MVDGPQPALRIRFFASVAREVAAAMQSVEHHADEWLDVILDHNNNVP